MNQYHAAVSRIIDAPPEQVYDIIADYHEGHPSILPARYFKNMIVTRGGRGEGTVTTVDMNVFGSHAVFQMSVTEPDPGRVLVERDDSAGVVTTFTVEPVNRGGASRVTIATEARTGRGLRGLMERLLNPPITRKMYREELEQLAGVVENRNGR